ALFLELDADPRRVSAVVMEPSRQKVCLLFLCALVPFFPRPCPLMLRKGSLRRDLRLLHKNMPLLRAKTLEGQTWDALGTSRYTPLASWRSRARSSSRRRRGRTRRRRGRRRGRRRRGRRGRRERDRGRTRKN
ncbi:hypothetical protein TGDOM2_297488, partial [Toxoplasma gondii GAB2-2007-GAL-DOM2]